MFSLIWFVLLQLTLVISAAVRIVELNNGWNLRDETESILIDNLKIPSGVYSAFASVHSLPLDDVLNAKNDVALRWIAERNWIYFLDFDVDPKDISDIQFINLTFHGIDTIAQINLNDHIFHTNNMFVRYSFDVKNKLKEKNRIEVLITSPIIKAKNLAARNHFTPPECPVERYNGECHMNFLRKMQASFAWDWGLAAPSMGIWKPVTLEFYDIALIRDIDVATTENPDYWELDIKIYLESQISKNYYGNLTVYAVDLLETPIKKDWNEISVNNHTIAFKEHIKSNKIEKWWPNGYGNQKLYHLHFSLTTWMTNSNNESDPRQLTFSQKSIRIGFRTIELVEEPMENGLSFYFRINGVPIFMKGTNYIPSHILPELGQDQNRINHLLQSVRGSHMNMIRVWGGGIYESDYFYDLADSLGILIWQDMMFACAMYPVFPDFISSVRTEVNQNAKRIAHHASLAIIATNNENEAALVQNWYGTLSERKRFEQEYTKLYVDTIIKELNVISHESRPKPLVSSPSNGKKNNNSIIDDNPQNNNYGDIHYYDYTKDGWDPNIYPKPRFSSEYGFQSFPAISSWEKVLGSKTTLDSLLEHRQHFPLGNFPLKFLIQRHLPLPNQDSPNYNDALIYMSQLSQAMVTKAETEVYRKNRGTEHNTMGALYWQLNDVWIAPSWSSIDFFGNYKILHHWTKIFMAPFLIIAHKDPQHSEVINVHVVCDKIFENPLNLNAVYKTYAYGDLFQKNENSWPVQITSNSAQLINNFTISDIIETTELNNFFVEFALVDKKQETLASTFYFPTKLKSVTGMRDPNLKIQITSRVYKNFENYISIQIKVDHPAIFVYLEIRHVNVTQYTFSQNGFIQLIPIQTIHLEFKNSSVADITERNIEVLTLNQFFQKDPIEITD